MITPVELRINPLHRLGRIKMMAGIHHIETVRTLFCTENRRKMTVRGVGSR